MDPSRTVIRKEQFIYKDRDRSRELCQTNASAGCTFVVGFFVLLFSCFGYVVYFLANPDGVLWSPIANFILAFVTMGYYFFKSGWKGDASPKTPLEFSPRKIYKTSIFNFINAFIFLISFFGIFFSLGDFGFSIFGGSCMLGIGLVLISRMAEQKKVYLKNKFFGTSTVEIQTPNVKLGETLSMKFINDMVQEKLFEVNVVFRNIHEHWVTEKNKKGEKKQDIQTLVFYEEKRVVQVIGGCFNLDFEIPKENVKHTDYLMNKPSYWEMEVSNEEVGYYCRFFIDILPNDEVILDDKLILKMKEKISKLEDPK